MKFSIITAIYNCENYLSETIDSLINQDIGFKDNVQLILVDDGSTDESRNIALDYQKRYPDNIMVLLKENGGPGSARNLGLDYANGEIINFLDGDDKLSGNTLSSVYSFFQNNDVNMVAIPIIFFGRRDGEHVLNYKFKKEQIVDLDELFDYPQLSISSSFIKSEAIADLKFVETLRNGEDALFLNKILLHDSRYGVLNNSYYLYRKRDDFSSIMDKTKKLTDFFEEKMVGFYLELINYSLENLGEVPKFIQYLIAYDLNSMVTAENFNPSNEFLINFNQVLSYIDKEILINHRYLSRNVKSFLICIKNQDFHAETNDTEVFLKSNDYTVNRLHNHKLRFENIQFNDNMLSFKGYFSSNCDVKFIDVIAFKNNDSFDTTFTNEKPFKKFFDVNWEFYYTFEVNIPIENKEECIITFYVNAFNVLLNNQIHFKKDAESFNSQEYFIVNDKIIKFKNNSFYIYNNTFRNRILFNLNIMN